MLVKQILEFELRGHGPPSRACTLTTGYFHDKANLSVDYYLLLKYYTKQCTVSNFSQPGPNHLQNLIPKCKIFNVF